MDVLQWVISIIVAILTFFGGRYYEKRKFEQENRLKLLEPIEGWVENISRIISIIGSELPSLSEGYQESFMYDQSDILETTKFIDENRDKVFGILNSTALHTFGTKNIINRLSILIHQLDDSVSLTLLGKHANISYKVKKREG
jgi:hypothetical protein